MVAEYVGFSFFRYTYILVFLLALNTRRSFKQRPFVIPQLGRSEAWVGSVSPLLEVSQGKIQGISQKGLVPKLWETFSGLLQDAGRMRFLVATGLRSRFLLAVGCGLLSPPCPETSPLSRRLGPVVPLHADFSLISSSNMSRGGSLRAGVISLGAG